jgi:hypothetical protein
MSEEREEIIGGLVPLHDPKPQELFKPGGLGSILDQIEAQARSLVADPATAKGRKQIASNAFMVSKAKAYLDKLRKEYVDHLKALPKQVDAEGKAMRDRLDALKDEVRKPLTDWEAAEAQKAQAIQARIQGIRDMASVDGGLPELETALQIVQGVVIGEEYGDASGDAVLARDAAVGRLYARIEVAKKSAAEAEARAKAEEEARVERERRIAEEARVAAERRAAQEAERVAKEAAAREAAAERKVVEAEAAAKRAIAEAEARAQAQAQAEEDRRLKAERDARAEADRRAADLEHRRKINRAAVAALVADGIAEDTARQVVELIVLGAVPGVSITY